MKTCKTLAVLAAAWLGCTAAFGAGGLPVGTVITGEVSGASTTLLGSDHGYAAEAGSHITALSAADIEYVTGDYAVFIDFMSDGRLQVTNNRDGESSLPGTYAFNFSFAGLSQPITGFMPLDLASVNGGTVSLQVLDAHSVSLTLNNVSFTNADYPSFTTQLTVSAVPEPGSLALLGAGLGIVALRRMRRAA
ncbi:hypothetical protein J2X16_001412 [Pelomonas aquatica]|uniref:Ice-binding protein C-terminal domain-containing protein n=1 Tax=Pelomonas aquatica TaxID=431058 RepID=A0ABU1Z642_9BURK|nr:PEP-CTERM sorting domain-containing protein [Pelomonas aquatica]MDR7296073.1 hypothetical protein [Pelomonas aquatica]